jgi:hypothetical protein
MRWQHGETIRRNHPEAIRRRRPTPCFWARDRLWTLFPASTKERTMAARSSERMKLLIPLALSLASLGFFIPSRDILAAMIQQPESRVWLELSIVDGKTSRPIRKATVQLMSPFDEPDETPNDDENHVNPAPGFEIDNTAAKPMFTDDLSATKRSSHSKKLMRPSSPNIQKGITGRFASATW